MYEEVTNCKQKRHNIMCSSMSQRPDSQHQSQSISTHSQTTSRENLISNINETNKVWTKITKTEKEEQNSPKQGDVKDHANLQFQSHPCLTSDSRGSWPWKISVACTEQDQRWYSYRESGISAMWFCHLMTWIFGYTLNSVLQRYA